MTTNKLDKVLLIDDSNADNFLHKRIIAKSGITENIIIKNNGFEALEYLTTPIDGKYPCPELVFLDINMPGMNGWEFLDEYKMLDEYKKAGVIICMLTTAYSNKDKEKAKGYDCVNDFLGKPLSEEKLMNVYGKLDKYEPNDIRFHSI